MYQTKALRNLFPLMFLCLTGVRAATGEPAPVATGSRIPDTLATTPTNLASLAAGVYAVAGKPRSGSTCRYDQVCTGDIVLITMQTDLSKLDRELVAVKVKVAKDPTDPKKGFLSVQDGKSDYRGFYYRVKPGKTYLFRATYYYFEKGGQRKRTLRFSESFYYKSRSDIHNPGAGAEGLVSPEEAKEMGGLPAIPICVSLKSPGQFCTNQVVHVFWNNDRGRGQLATDVDLYINDQFYNHGAGPKHGGNYWNYFYVLPAASYIEESISFRVTWQVWNADRPFSSHFENSNTLVSSYTPGFAFACKLTDSWEKCQDQLRH